MGNGCMFRTALLILAILAIGCGLVFGCENQSSCPCTKWKPYEGQELEWIEIESAGKKPVKMESTTIIKLSCETCGKDNYTTDKNRRNMPEKFRIKKYCPKCRSHHSHKEGKISKG